MPAATIQYNKTKSRFNVVLDDGEETGWGDVPADGMGVMEEDQVAVTLHNYTGELESNTVYDLEALETEIEDDVEEDEEDDEEIEVEEGEDDGEEEDDEDEED